MAALTTVTVRVREIPVFSNSVHSCVIVSSRGSSQRVELSVLMSENIGFRNDTENVREAAACLLMT